MRVQAIDTLYIVGDPAPYCRLGLQPRPAVSRPPFQIGCGDRAVGLTFISDDPTVADAWPAPSRVGMFAIGLRVPDVSAATNPLDARALPWVPGPDYALLKLHGRMGVEVILGAQHGPQDSHPIHSFPL